jgi:serine/threonine protein phosphatase PrpC/TolA-binding protein
MELKVGYVCDRGLNPKRPVNQDRLLAIKERGLFAVFDGVGGQRAGEVASQTAAETIEEALAHTSAASSAELIRRAIQFANRDIFEMAESDPAYKTMATTVALIHIDGDRATVAHVGDSRVYRLEDGRFYRETVDHTDLNDDLRAGLISEQQASEQGERNVINRALGVESDVDVEIKTVRVRDGVRFLLCSDGVYRHMADEEIARVLAENKDPQRAADELKRVVYERGADDNLTAIVVQAGRARQSQVIAIEGSRPGAQKARAARAGEVAGSSLPRPAASSRGGRIKVDFGTAQNNVQQNSVQPGGLARAGEPMRYADAERGRIDWPEHGGRRFSTRAVMYTLLVLLLVAGAFYAGLRADDLGDDAPPENAPADLLAEGRFAFDAGNYQAAAGAFAALVEREPQNAQARYWLGRSEMEAREYLKAAQSFEQAIAYDPMMRDAYVQAAAAYEALGERAKAVEKLDLYRRAVNDGPRPRSTRQ